MTDIKPGGVAGQVTEFIGTRINSGHEHVAALGGALAMHNALSREARVILADTLSDPDPNPLVQFALYVGQKQMAERLGLNLESEDAE